MTPADAAALLEQVRRGAIPVPEALRAFQAEPVSDLGFAVVDHHRALRQGAPEIIYGGGKTPDQVAAIAARLVKVHGRALATRVGEAHARKLRSRFKTGATFHEAARCITVGPPAESPARDAVAVVAAGTSDLPVAEEAAVTAEFLGLEVRRIHDVGVSGLHRLLRRLPEIQGARVLIVVAGMEAALPSVIGGLVDRPIIGVPTSVGYGAHLNGLAALLGMLNSCASGMTVVNIDNGFGAAFAALRIHNAFAPQPAPTPPPR